MVRQRLRCLPTHPGQVGFGWSPSWNLTFIYETPWWEYRRLLWDKSVDTLHKDKASHTQKLLPQTALQSNEDSEDGHPGTQWLLRRGGQSGWPGTDTQLMLMVA